MNVCTDDTNLQIAKASPYSPYEFSPRAVKRIVENFTNRFRPLFLAAKSRCIESYLGNSGHLTDSVIGWLSNDPDPL